MSGTSENCYCGCRCTNQKPGAEKAWNYRSICNTCYLHHPYWLTPTQYDYWIMYSDETKQHMVRNFDPYRALFAAIPE